MVHNPTNYTELSLFLISIWIEYVDILCSSESRRRIVLQVVPDVSEEFIASILRHNPEDHNPNQFTRLKQFYVSS
jgi:hypothetical protein